MCKLITLILLCHIFMTSIGVSALDLPPCYEACLDKLIKTALCSPIDTYCFCTNEVSKKIIGVCVCQNCGWNDIQTSIALGSAACSQAGATVQFTSCANLSSSASGISSTGVAKTSNLSSPMRGAASPAARMIGIGTSFIVTAATLVVLAL